MADRHKYTLRPSGVLDEVSLPVLNFPGTRSLSHLKQLFTRFSSFLKNRNKIIKY